MLHSRNTLYYGDNLPVLREHIPDASVDLVYLDPPFNSNRNYNILFKDEHGQDLGAGGGATPLRRAGGAQDAAA